MKKLLIIPILFFIILCSSCEKPAQKYGNIFDAVNHLDPEAVEDFVKKDPKLVDKTNEQGVPVLIFSIAKGQPVIATILVNNGAEVNVRDTGNLSRDYTPLHWAARQGHNDLVRLLLEKGADPNAVSKSGETPLHLTSSQGKIETAEILISKGADLNIKDLQGLTPYDSAEKNGKSDYVKSVSEKMKSQDGVKKTNE